MAANNNTLPIPEFNGDDYEYWSIKMKTLLIGKGLWDIIEEGYNEPQDWNALQGNDKNVKKEAQRRTLLLFTIYKQAWKRVSFQE